MSGSPPTQEHEAYLDEVEVRFAQSDDLTVAIEEEFQILDPRTLALAQRFEELRDAAPSELDIRGELLTSEIEITTEKCPDFSTAAERLSARRHGLFALAREHWLVLGATATHPFSGWRDQRIIDTPHYRLVEDSLKYVAWRNNTWSVHVHVGVRGGDRAVAVSDALRTYLPHLLALSANSPFIEDMWTELASARVQTFVRMFPRCGVPDVFGDWSEHRRFVAELFATNCIREFTQIWWSVRPHHKFGTVEIRICDAQTELWQSLAVAALTYSLVAALLRRYDEGEPLLVLPTRYVEENLWRAIRYGLDGKLVDWEAGEEVPAAEAVRRLTTLAAPFAEGLGLNPHLDAVEKMLREGNGAQQQVKAHLEGESPSEIFARTVAQARATSLGLTPDLREEHA
jgi:carboxylate-amine ligase